LRHAFFGVYEFHLQLDIQSFTVPPGSSGQHNNGQINPHDSKSLHGCLRMHPYKSMTYSYIRLQAQF